MHTIRRASHGIEDHYFPLSRAAAQDKNLSYEARGMLVYLLSKPKDWIVRVDDLAIESCGRDKVRRILKELVDAGYAIPPKRINAGDSKQFEWTSYIILEKPEAQEPSTENPYMAKPDMEEPYMANTDIYKKENQQKGDRQKREEKHIAANAAQDVLPAMSDSAEKAKPTRKPNAMYDAICEVWGFSGAMNGRFAKFLTGVATEKGYKDCNLTSPVTPEELLRWNRWYRAKNARPDFVMVKSPAKVQESLIEFRAQQQKRVVPYPQQPTPLKRQTTDAELDALLPSATDGMLIIPGVND